ncbi:MAG: type II toxin-antitoxin system VapC family toxin [Ignavibacteriales bacterium]|nr:type II toxin-antitoxin system VapC family toxin [Ignavibacteriales bacterium]
MKKIFADTVYWVALFNPKDALHRTALTSMSEHSDSIIVTTEAVLSEVLNQFSSYGVLWRTTVASEIENLFAQERIIIHSTSHNLFVQSLMLYKSRPDKNYSHVDCISMVVMKNENISEVLSSDRHFEQEGFTLLLR